ncbi:MAG: Type IV-A pilus assembly ATPase PilB [Parcubacteria group bacterium GW2011_GWC1_41_7]|nr:MAG: Type IV-A pilus assembly ATPase PilB [Parcubacteria group bacterium GW2011_GWC1_41_7]
MTQKYEFDKEEEEVFQKIKNDEEEDISKRLAHALGLRYIEVGFRRVDPDALRIIPEAIAKKLKIIGIEKRMNSLVVGVINPTSAEINQYIQELTNQGFIVTKGIISESSFHKALEEYRFIKEKKVRYLEGLDIQEAILTKVSEEIKGIDDLKKIIAQIAKENPFVILEYLLSGASTLGASDIHMEPSEHEILVKYRIDGVLVVVAQFPKNIYVLIKNRIKLAAKLLVNVENKPQDGKFSILLKDLTIDIRLSTIPSAYDETIVMRLLDPRSIVVDLKDMGFRTDDYEIMKRTIELPNGLILNTGPTGSGKTTTLYAILNKIKRPEIKIITVEDPIEYHMDGISQTQVDARHGYTFASGLRSILRQDPDIILIGEIRDNETAEIAINSALTGHLVLSTLHTNDSLGAIPRLLNLKVEKTLIPPSLRLIIAQRLVRRICTSCGKLVSPPEDLKKKILDIIANIPQHAKANIDVSNIQIYESGGGCEACHKSGYKGRVGVFELLRVTPAIEQVVYETPSEIKLFEVARKEGFVTLKEDGVLKLLQKLTTVEEIGRVLGVL